MSSEFGIMQVMKTAVGIADFSIEDVLAQNDKLRCVLESRDHQIKLLEEKIHYLLHHRFGSKSERFDERQQLLFDNVDTTCEVKPATEIKVPEYTRNAGGRRVPPQNLPRVRVEHDLSEEEKLCVCGGCLNRIGEEVSFQYDVIPAKFQVIENVKLKYGCSNSTCNQPPKTAEQNPPSPLPRTQASPGVLAWLGTSKFADGLPLNRIAVIAQKRFGVPFTSTTLADWTIKGAERIISPLVVAMERALCGHDYLHIDETTLQVLSEEGRTAKQKSYIWCRVTGGNDTPIVLMDYSPSRAGAVASKLLKEFSGYLHTDGYAGYDASASRPGVTQLGCWAHVRRKFDAASKACSPGAANIARQGLELIRELYHLDKRGIEKPLDERRQYRQEIVNPHLNNIRSWVNTNQAHCDRQKGVVVCAKRGRCKGDGNVVFTG